MDNLDSACSLVAAGLGVSFVPAGIQHVRPIVLRRLRPALPGVDANVTGAYRRDSSSELLGLFLDVVRDVAALNRRGTQG